MCCLENQKCSAHVQKINNLNSLNLRTCLKACSDIHRKMLKLSLDSFRNLWWEWQPSAKKKTFQEGAFLELACIQVTNLLAGTVAAQRYLLPASVKLDSSSSSQFENRTWICSFFIGKNENLSIITYFLLSFLFDFHEFSHVFFLL